ncbi:hypothetical protein ACJQWK_03066 [Exserohilum turcicum]|uniref:Fe2OG dioxygenase domain-containing protein n=1 Tax=Exserohilum turcicum (strain 28A) TaxID=671987 RepID=R0J4K3_EXST2|nr:uncharacterized protein SETTUDRAFT_133764 [Exserohilum turcica Et28A]EOA91875.1 hypothetical protein SETTUDRAFT_133764 [Exserohilum turcica Et28A]
MSDMEAALHTAQHTQSNGAPSVPPTSLNPTPETGTRYERPIAAAQQDGLPIIDISSFMDPNGSREARSITAKAINAACINYGFFYLTGHGIPESKLNDIISLAREFFALPLEEKCKIQRFDAGSPQGGDGARGYQCLGENVTNSLQDMQEAIDWYREWPADKREPGDGGPGSVKSLQGVNLWPERPESLRPMYEEYVERVMEVGKAVVHAMGVALDLGPPRSSTSDGSAVDEEDEEIFVRNCKDSFWVMRMIGYPPLSSPPPSSSSSNKSNNNDGTTNPDTEDISQFSCGAHTDYGCVTLLLTDPTPGSLQVQLKNGSWLNADPLPGAFVVNIGDMIERWTNGLWKSTLHRVIHRGTRYRVSVPFFYEPAFEAVVRPLDKCVNMTVRSTGDKRIHAGSTYGEHLLTKVFSNFYYSKRTDW